MSLIYPTGNDVCVSVKIEVYVYEIDPRYFYRTQTSPEIWTHIFEFTRHKICIVRYVKIVSFFFFFKLLIIHPKEYNRFTIV